jgi:hypothetical protein
MMLERLGFALKPAFLELPSKLQFWLVKVDIFWFVMVRNDPVQVRWCMCTAGNIL